MEPCFVEINTIFLRNPIDTRATGYERLTVSNTQHSAAELLPQLLNDEGVLNGEGSIAFTKPDRTTARIFLRQGNIYAVDNLEYENNLWSELRFEEHITHGNLRALIRAHKSQRDSLYKLLRRTRNKLKNQDNLLVSLQEYVLGAIDDIYSWDSVKIEWRMGDVFPYDGADVTPFPLAHLLTLCVNRSLFKFNKYEEWGFKNDDQFLFGNVLLESDDMDKLKASSHLEETILFAKKFVIKGLIENTGFSIFTVASALDDLSKRATVKIENPSGRQKPTSLPQIPHDVPVVEDKIHFSATDEDPDMLKMFNTEYHVPEPAILEDTQETFNREHKLKESDSSNEVFNSYDDVINDTSSMEIVNGKLPELHKEKAELNPTVRRPIPKEDLDKEESANDIQALYKSMEKEVPKARGIVKKPVAPVKASPEVTEELTEVDSSKKEETAEPVSDQPEIVEDKIVETLTLELKGNKMSSESPLFAILEQLESQLSNQKNLIAAHRSVITEKESALQSAKNEVNRLTMELANEIGAKENATTEYEKALSIITTLNN